jgi:hypothetical protein
MTRDDIIRMAREAGLGFLFEDHLLVHDELQCFAALVADAEAKRMHAEGMVTVGHMRQQIAAERNKLAHWMMAQGYATGHGDTTEDLLQELDWQITESWSKVVVASVEAEREACAKVAHSGRDPRPASDPETYLPGVRTASLLTANSIAAAIRARGQT